MRVRDLGARPIQKTSCKFRAAVESERGEHSLVVASIDLLSNCRAAADEKCAKSSSKVCMAHCTCAQCAADLELNRMNVERGSPDCHIPRDRSPTRAIVVISFFPVQQ